MGHIVATAVPGCEEVRDGTYRRTLRADGGPAVVALRPGVAHVDVTLLLSDVDDEAAALAGCRRLLDLDAGPDVDLDGPDGAARSTDPAAVAEVLLHDPVLRPVVEHTPGQRLPGSVDPEELAVRAVLGQQVSTAAARTLGARLLVAHGSPLPPGAPWHATGSGLTHLWPSVAQLVDVDPSTLAMPRSRQRTFGALVQAIAHGDVRLTPGADVQRAREALAGVPGIGPWTVEIIAMRGLGDPDAFPATDLGVRRAADRLGLPSAAGALLRRAERWRPYRAYAAQYLWSTLDHDVNRDWRGRAVGGAA